MSGLTDITKTIIIALAMLLALAPGVAAQEKLEVASVGKTVAVEKHDTATSGMVEIRERSVIHGKQILLKNIGKVKGFTPPVKADYELIYFSHAPRPGAEQTFSRRYVEKVLRSNGVKGQFQIPEQITVVRASQEIDDKQLESLLTEAALEQTGLEADRLSLKIARKNGGIMLPYGDTSLTVAFPPDEKFRGLATAKVTPYVNGRKQRAFFVTARVEIRGEALYSTREMKRGDVVSPADIEQREVILSKMPLNFIKDKEDVLGMEVSARIRKGEVIRATAVESPELVRRGDLVMLVIETKGMRVESRGIAQQAGKRGQVIKVKNLGSNKLVYGEVRNSSEVRVPL